MWAIHSEHSRDWFHKDIRLQSYLKLGPLTSLYSLCFAYRTSPKLGQVLWNRPYIGPISLFEVWRTWYARVTCWWSLDLRLNAASLKMRTSFWCRFRKFIAPSSPVILKELRLDSSWTWFFAPKHFVSVLGLPHPQENEDFYFTFGMWPTNYTFGWSPGSCCCSVMKKNRNISTYEKE